MAYAGPRRVVQGAEDTYVVTNNHNLGKAVVNAFELKRFRPGSMPILRASWSSDIPIWRSRQRVAISRMTANSGPGVGRYPESRFSSGRKRHAGLVASGFGRVLCRHPSAPSRIS